MLNNLIDLYEITNEESYLDDALSTRITHGDTVIYYNYRGDRPRELMAALVEPEFEGSDRVAPSPDTGRRGFDRAERLDLHPVIMTAYSERLAELKDKVAKIGEVNLAALSDYQTANERYLFLQKQEDDLAQSILGLHQTIEKMDETTKQLFSETFEQVNERFKTNFERLFSGGRAELILVDPTDPLESGIDIKASPPGKTMQNIQLLSGGEKAMTAISLLFAILQVRPSPFCLLDEVDAPLDEANVTRFQDMLREMSEKTQFIMITHNQKTMSFADTLYGVTMEERGVSKVVSVHLNS